MREKVGRAGARVSIPSQSSASSTFVSYQCVARCFIICMQKRRIHCYVDNDNDANLLSSLNSKHVDTYYDVINGEIKFNEVVQLITFKSTTSQSCNTQTSDTSNRLHQLLL